MSLQIASPFEQFFDRDGSPLDNGFVYVGVANQNPETNPLTVYFDDALTIPAAQPLQTSNGYIVRNGSPARLYTSQEDFSLTVRDKSGVLVFTVADATSASNLATQFAQFVSDLADGSGSSLVGYNQGSLGAVDRTVQGRLRDHVSVNDFPDIQTAIAAAIADDFIVGVSEDTTVRVPTDAPTLQAAFDRVTPLNVQCQIDVLIESGHQPTAGLTVANGDYGQFSISSVDAEVIVAPSYATHWLLCSNARAPVMNCLVNANNLGTFGCWYQQASTGLINSGCGVKNDGGSRALYVNNSIVTAVGSIFTGAANRGFWVAWGSLVRLDEADFSNCGAFGGYSNWISRNSHVTAFGITINNSVGTAIGLNRISSIMCHEATITNAGVSAIAANRNSKVVMNDAVITGNFGGNVIDIFGGELWADGASITSSTTAVDGVVVSSAGNASINFATISGFRNGVLIDNAASASINGTTISGCSSNGILVQTAATASVRNSSVTGSGNVDLAVIRGGVISADATTTTTSVGTPALADTNLPSGFNFTNNGNRGIIWV